MEYLPWGIAGEPKGITLRSLDPVIPPRLGGSVPHHLASAALTAINSLINLLDLLSEALMQYL